MKQKDLWECAYGAGRKTSHKDMKKNVIILNKLNKK